MVSEEFRLSKWQRLKRNVREMATTEWKVREAIQAVYVATTEELQADYVVARTPAAYVATTEKPWLVKIKSDKVGRTERV